MIKLCKNIGLIKHKIYSQYSIRDIDSNVQQLFLYCYCYSIEYLNISNVIHRLVMQLESIFNK